MASSRLEMKAWIQGTAEGGVAEKADVLGQTSG